MRRRVARLRESQRLCLGLLRLFSEPAALGVLGNLHGDPAAALAVHVVVRRLHRAPALQVLHTRTLQPRRARRLLLQSVVERQVRLAQVQNKSPVLRGFARLQTRRQRAALARVHAHGAEPRVRLAMRTKA